MTSLRLFTVANILLLGVPAVSMATGSILPQPFPASRYEKMLETSPFDVATKVEEVVKEDKHSFCESWKITGIVTEKDENGAPIDRVWIRKQGESSSFSVFGAQVNPDEHVQVVKIEWNPQLGKQTVKLKNDGGEEGEITWDGTDFSSTGAPQPEGGGGGNRGPAAVPQPGQPPAVRPSYPPRPNQFRPPQGGPQGPGVRQQGPRGPAIPRPTAPTMVPPQPIQPGQQNNANNPGNNRRRIRSIPSPGAPGPNQR